MNTILISVTNERGEEIFRLVVGNVSNEELVSEGCMTPGAEAVLKAAWQSFQITRAGL